MQARMKLSQLFATFILLFSVVGVNAAPGSLSVGFTGTHATRGGFLDVTVNQDLEITGFDLNLAQGSQTIEIYYKSGATTLADTTNSGAWTLHDTVVVTGNGQGVASSVSITPFAMSSGQTVAFYTVSDTDGDMFNESGDGATSGASDAAMTILSAFESHGLFSGAYQGWPWQGTVHYNTLDLVAPTSIPTMSVWGLGILAGLLGLIGMRRRMN